jgi:AcrR family transcriptional regulator
VETRARLLAVACQMVEEAGYPGLRVEDLVARAGVAKGTFFTHFQDKDTLMDHLIGARIDQHLDHLARMPAPASVEQLADAMLPLLAFLASERFVFDVVLRRSGAAAIEEIGPIAETLGRLAHIFAGWLPAAPFRRDVAPDVLTEGFEALSLQVLALNFCGINKTLPMRERYVAYLRAWLLR